MVHPQFLYLNLVICVSDLVGHCLKSVFLFSFIHSIVNRIIKLGNTPSSFALAPALVETYSRLLVYMEIESLGIKGFISKTSHKTLFEDSPFYTEDTGLRSPMFELRQVLVIVLVLEQV